MKTRRHDENTKEEDIWMTASRNDVDVAREE